MALALVTGATGGIGKAICSALARNGYDLMMTARSADKLEALRHKFSLEFPRLTVAWLAGDLGDSDFIDALFESLPAEKDLAVVVNNAGVSLGEDIFSSSEGDWSRSIAVNLTAPFLIIKKSLPKMQQRGGGSIVNIASMAAVQGARKPGYAASKAGLVGLTKAAALGAGKVGVRVNAVLPGAVDTELIADWNDAKRRAISEGTVLGHIAGPDEIADVVAFLASEQARFVTGTTVNVTGGAYLGN